MANKFISSEKIKVFPCASRSATYDPEAKLNTEYNFTHLGASAAGFNKSNSYVINFTEVANGANNTSKLTFVLGGYYFEITDIYSDIDLFESIPETIYFCIKTADYPITGAIKTPMLASWTTETETIPAATIPSLDNTNNEFTGLLLTDTLPADCTYLPLFIKDANPAATKAYKINPATYLPNIKTDQNNNIIIDSAGNTIIKGSQTNKVVIGQNNENINATILEVGNGSVDTPSNAFAVYTDGHAEVKTSTTSSNSATTLTTKDYVENCVNTETTRATNAENTLSNRTTTLETWKNNLNIENGTGTGSLQQKDNTASGDHAFAEGNGTIAYGTNSHAEGNSTTASEESSHAEGKETTASGEASHAEGKDTTAVGEASHASGLNTTAGYDFQTVIGKYNDNKSNTLFEAGNGTSSTPSNAFEVYEDGHAEVGLMGDTNKSVATKEYVDSKENLIEITWSALKNLRDSSQLMPGTFYRITDYSCTTSTEGTSSAGHVFDIIVRADSINKLNEVASAIHHTNDLYFAVSNLSAWKLWYCLDNDTNRFAWADTTNGKGVIYRMIDEFNNDCPYDFKNILFTTSGKYTNAYTFSYTATVIKDASLLGISKSCHNNIMKENIKLNQQRLNFNVFYTTDSYFDCYSNTFGYGCYSNTFSNYCSKNTFGNDCYSNTFSNYCYSNTFGNSFHENTFGYGCCSNAFGNNCSKNTFGNVCDGNTFENAIYENTFGNNCSKNTFGNQCNNIIFGTSTSTLIDYVHHITIEPGCRYLNISCAEWSGSNDNYIQNIHIHSGVSGANENEPLLIIIPERNIERSIDYKMAESEEILLARPILIDNATLKASLNNTITSIIIDNV